MLNTKTDKKMSNKACGNAKKMPLEALHRQVEALMKQNEVSFLLALIQETPKGENCAIGSSKMKLKHVREILKVLSSNKEVLHIFANVLAESLIALHPEKLPLETLAAISTALLPLEGMAEVWEAAYQNRLNETQGEEAEEYEV